MNETFARLLLMSAAALCVYYVLPRRVQNEWLLAASYVFYALWSVPHTVLLLVITLFNYAAALLITRLTGRARQWVTIVGIAINLLSLISLKYARISFSDALSFLLPLGISFIALQAIAYLIEVNKGRIPAERGLIDFALYLAYFPKIAAGPIERPRPFLNQLKAPRVVDNDTLRRAFTLIMLGIVRKVLFADMLSRMLNPKVFDDPLSYDGATLAISLITYAFLIYNDFAGYSSLARGISELFGIHLTANFQQPYLARNISEFWARWHISLSDWLRDYIYFPVSRSLTKILKNREHLIHIVIPPLAVMIFSALWHEARLHMLGWGLIHAAYLIARRLPPGRTPPPPDRLPRVVQIASVIVTFVLVTLAWVPFRASTANSLIYWQRMFMLVDAQPVSLVAFVIIVPSLLLDLFEQRGDQEMAFVRLPRLARASLLAVCILILAAVFMWPSIQSPTPIYQGF